MLLGARQITIFALLRASESQDNSTSLPLGAGGPFPDHAFLPVFDFSFFVIRKAAAIVRSSNIHN